MSNYKILLFLYLNIDDGEFLKNYYTLCCQTELSTIVNGSEQAMAQYYYYKKKKKIDENLPIINKTKHLTKRKEKGTR
jgi:hypothetical protein